MASVMILFKSLCRGVDQIATDKFKWIKCGYIYEWINLLTYIHGSTHPSSQFAVLYHSGGPCFYEPGGHISWR